MTSHARPHIHSRRRVAAIAVPSAMAIVLAGAFVATPALASGNPTLPFPTVCPSDQTAAPGSASASPSTSTSPTPSTTASPSTSASPTPSTGGTPTQGAKSLSSPSASPSGTGAGAGTGTASPGPSPSTSAGSGGFWGWLNGVWTWILSDAPYTAHTGAVAADALYGGRPNAVAANAPLHEGGHFEDVADGAGTPGPADSPSCLSAASAAALASKAAAGGTSEGVSAVTIPWVMKTPVLSLYNLTYNGVKTVEVLDPDTGKYTDEKVLDFTSSKVTIDSMVTYSIQSGQTVYNNAGSGTTTTLIDAHLMTVSLSGSLFGLVPQTYTPSNPPPLPVGLTVPLIPVVFTGVTTQLAFLNTGSIAVPGFDGFAQDGVASPQ